MNYDQALSKLQTARDVTKGKPIANNTRLFQHDAGAIAVRLHETDIATLYANGDVRLDTGGWKSVTTKARMQEFAPVRVWSTKGTWYACKVATGTHHLYADGMVLHADGTCSGAAPDDTPKVERALRKRIKTYAVGFVEALYAGRVGLPSGGDCFICQARMPGTGHLDAHMTESYYVPSLLQTALESRGASTYTLHSVGTLMRGDVGVLAPWVRRECEKALCHYIGRAFGLAV